MTGPHVQLKMRSVKRLAKNLKKRFVGRLGMNINEDVGLAFVACMVICYFQACLLLSFRALQ